MVTNFTTEQLTKMLCEKLKLLNYNITLSNPSTQSEFPIIVIHTPLESTIKQHNAEILQRKFQITIECWTDEKYSMMQMMEEVSQILVKINFLRTSTIPDIFDETTQKYKMSMTFEAVYNGLTNSFI